MGFPIASRTDSRAGRLVHPLLTAAVVPEPWRSTAGAADHRNDPVPDPVAAPEPWRSTAGAGVLAFAAGALVPGWTLPGGLIGAVLLAVVVGAVSREGAPARLGAANRVTIGRLAILGALAGYGLSLPFTGAVPGWAPCLAYAGAAALDLLDGALARRTGSETAFGARLDAEADALGIAAASGIAALALGTLPPWYLGAGFARYLFGAGLVLERRSGRRVRPLDPSPFRRRLAGFQMGMLAVCLAPGIEAEWATPSAFALGVPFLLGFLRDYLVVTGRGDPWRRLAGAERFRPVASRAATLAAALLGTAKLAGFPTGSLALAAFFFAWLIRPRSTLPRR